MSRQTQTTGLRAGHGPFQLPTIKRQEPAWSGDGPTDSSPTTCGGAVGERECCFDGAAGARLAIAAARRFYDRVRVIARAASLGDLASLLTHPDSFSHRDLPPAERAAAGIADGLLRLSVGIEDAGDLEQDIEQALADD